MNGFWTWHLNVEPVPNDMSTTSEQVTTPTPAVAPVAAPLSDNARRWICQLAFLVLCVVPTAMTAWAIAHRPGPDWWEQTIMATCGLSASIDSVETPRPGLTLLRGVHIERPVNPVDKPIKLSLIEIKTGPLQQIVVHDPVNLTSGELNRLVRQLREHVIGLDLVDGQWELHLSKLTLAHERIDAARHTLSPVTVIASRDQDGVQVDLIGESAVVRDSIGVSIRIPAAAGEEPTFIGVRSDRAPLPCWVVSAWFPNATRLGSEASFQGQAQILIQPDGTADISARGKLSQVDFADLLASSELSWRGKGDVDLDFLSTRAGKIHLLRGGLSSQDGVIHRELIASAGTHLEMIPLAEMPSEWVPYGQLAFQFDVNQGQLMIAASHHNGVLFDRNGVPLLDCSYLPNDQAIRQSVVNLAQFWAASRAVTDPAARTALATSADEVNQAVVDVLKHFDLPEQRQARAETTPRF